MTEMLMMLRKSCTAEPNRDRKHAFRGENSVEPHTTTAQKYGMLRMLYARALTKCKTSLGSYLLNTSRAHTTITSTPLRRSNRGSQIRETFKKPTYLARSRGEARGRHD